MPTRAGTTSGACSGACHVNTGGFTMNEPMYRELDDPHAIEVGYRAWLAIEFEELCGPTPGLLAGRMLGWPSPVRWPEIRQSLRSDQDYHP